MTTARVDLCLLEKLLDLPALGIRIVGVKAVEGTVVDLELTGPDLPDGAIVLQYRQYANSSGSRLSVLERVDAVAPGAGGLNEVRPV